VLLTLDLAMSDVSKMLTKLDCLQTVYASLSETAQPDFIAKHSQILLRDMSQMSFTVEEAAVLISKLKGMAFWGQALHDSLVSAVGDRVGNPAFVVLRKQTQDYTQFVHYLTEDTWKVLLDASTTPDDKLNTLMKQLLKLGLRFPSEQTYAMICALVHSRIEDDAPHYRFCKLQEIKTSVKRECDASLERAACMDTLPSDPRVFLERAAVQTDPFVSCPLDLVMLNKAVKSIPLRCTNKNSRSLSGMPNVSAPASGQMDLMSLLQGAVNNIVASQVANRPHIQMLRPLPRPALLQRAAASSQALLNLQYEGVGESPQIQAPNQHQVPPPLPALEDKKTEAPAAEGSSLQPKSPLAVIAMLQSNRCMKRPASASKEKATKETKEKKTGVKQTAAKKKVSVKQSNAGSKPLPTKSQALKLRPKGCGRCRRTPGCFPGCWLRRKPYKK
jgi:hypothetical protein